MKKTKIILIILLLNFLLGCQSVQKALTPVKKNGVDEFLVKKKTPLVIPPSYNELPKPNPADEIDNKNSDEVNIKSLISNNVLEIDEDKKKFDSRSLIEDSIIKKLIINDK